MLTTLTFIQCRTSLALRRLACALDIDTDDAGFTTVEKVVLTGVAVGIALAAGAIIMTKVRDLANNIDTTPAVGP